MVGLRLAFINYCGIIRNGGGSISMVLLCIDLSLQINMLNIILKYSDQLSPMQVLCKLKNLITINIIFLNLSMNTVNHAPMRMILQYMR